MHRIGKDIVAGVAGGTAMMGAMAIDLAWFGNRTDDRLLLGGVVTSSIPRAKSIGLGMHFAASAAMGIVHGAACRKLKVRPSWRTGLGLAMLENTALYPLVAFESFHPAYRRGDLESFLAPLPIAQEVWRHVAFGVAMGITAGLLRD